MKTLRLIFFAALILLGLQSFSQTVRWPAVIEYEVSINNTDPSTMNGLENSLSWYHDNIEASFFDDLWAPFDEKLELKK